MYRTFAFLLFLGAFSINAQASTYSVTPCVDDGTSCFHVNITSNINDPTFLESLTGVADLQLLYKANEGSPVTESGTFFDNYETTFVYTVEDPLSEVLPPTLEPTGANITHDTGEASISCPECFLIVKDGNAGNPSQYVIDIGDWDGLMTLALSNFWGGSLIEDIPGSISNVAIWGKVSPVPVPAAVWLFGTALLGFIGFSRRTQV